MIGLVLSMLRARPAQALTAFLLATFAMAAAVSAPVYVAAADRAVVTSEVAGATVRERTVQVRRYAVGGDHKFEELAPDLFAVAGFRSVFSAEFNAFVDSGVAGSKPVVPRAVYRDDVCTHIRLIAGRCFASTSEVILSQDAVDTLKIGVGTAVGARLGVYTRDGWFPAPDATPVELTVVGVYAPVDPGEQYWADLDYFDPRLTDRLVTAPMFANRRTLEMVDHTEEQQAIDVVVGQDAITGESLATVDLQVRDGMSELGGLSGATALNTDLPQLLQRVERNRALLTDVVPIAAVPLVLLCWFVLFVAVAAAAEERRHELGLLSLRGVRAPHRWWLASGESLLPILLGSAAGFLLGHLLVRVCAALLLTGAGDVPLSTGASRWTLIAVTGAVLAGVLAQRHQLAQATIDLLRNVPSRVGRWRAAVFEAVVVLLAVAAVAQLRGGDQGWSGVGLLAPALVVMAVALVAARTVVPIADRTGARALREGRLGSMLAAYALARRPGNQRLLALFVVAIALVSFASIASDVSARARDERVSVELGADRVIDVEGISRTGLLAKVRAADPQGTFAMAVMSRAPEESPVTPRLLALDSSRLAAVAQWRGGALAGGEAADRLHPPAPQESIVLNDAQLDVDMTVVDLREGFRVRLVAVVAPRDGSDLGRINLGPLRFGRHTYGATLPVCGGGCRLVALVVEQPEQRPFAVDLTLHEVRQAGRVVIDTARFGQVEAWRAPESPGPRLLVPTLERASDGLRVRLTEYTGRDVVVSVSPVDAPRSLPVIVASATGVDGAIAGLDRRLQAAEGVGRVPALPRLGRDGILVDFEYADRLTVDAGEATEPEVWLGPAAPPDALDRLRAQGLVIAGDRRLATLRQALDEQGPASALRFHQMAGALGVLLAAGALWLVAGLDRQRRGGELRALRTQGVSRRDAGASGYLVMVATAAAIGPVAALVCWLLVGGELPFFIDDASSVDVPRWPGVVAVAAPWLAAALTLVGVAALAGARLRATTEGARR